MVAAPDGTGLAFTKIQRKPMRRPGMNPNAATRLEKTNVQVLKTQSNGIVAPPRTSSVRQ